MSSPSKPVQGSKPFLSPSVYQGASDRYGLGALQERRRGRKAGGRERDTMSSKACLSKRTPSSPEEEAKDRRRKGSESRSLCRGLLQKEGATGDKELASLRRVKSRAATRRHRRCWGGQGHKGGGVDRRGRSVGINVEVAVGINRTDRKKESDGAVKKNDLNNRGVYRTFAIGDGCYLMTAMQNNEGIQQKK